MAKRTTNLQVFPWVGGLVTSIDETLIPVGALTIADNITFDFNDSKKRREGINYNWDNNVFLVTSRSSSGTTRTITGTFTNTGIAVGDKVSFAGAGNALYNGTELVVTAVSGTALSYTATASVTESPTTEYSLYWANKVIGGIDFWFGSEDTKAHYLVSVLDNGAVYYTSNGVRTRLTDAGTPWDIPPTGLAEANLEVFQNNVVIAVSGLNNRMKHWDGDPTAPLDDLPANAIAVSVSRASSGTTRTLIFNSPVNGLTDGEEVIINGGPAAYNGRFALTSGAGTTTLTYTASTSLTESTIGDTAITAGVAAPLALFIREHLGSLWANDKTELDRLHYSGAGTAFEWGGVGTSGAHDIGVGDGDPVGLTGIAPTFKGDLFVGKRTKLYRLVGQDPDLVQIIKVSTGIGFLSHQGVVGIDQDDLFFVSDRGIHSMSTTNAYGDYSATYISKDIQKTFIEDFEESRKKYIKAAYLPQLNSAVFAVSESGSAENNSIYLFNVPKGYWYRWPNIQAETLISAQDADKRRLYLGTYQARLSQTLTNSNVDTTFSNQTTTIANKVATGLMLVDGRPDTVKGFKRLRIVFRGSGSYTITAKVKIDNFSEQAIAFVSNQQDIPLGAFILGEDVLGGSFVTAPYSLPIDGYGRGIKITIEQNDLNTALAIQGFMIEYIGGQDSPETRSSDKD
jgi:hypothetical protein